MGSGPARRGSKSSTASRTSCALMLVPRLSPKAADELRVTGDGSTAQMKLPLGVGTLNIIVH